MGCRRRRLDRDTAPRRIAAARPHRLPRRPHAYRNASLSRCRHHGAPGGSDKNMSRIPLIALVGNPNAGKSALFNALTGARQKLGNYPGVTVERKRTEEHTSELQSLMRIS